MWRTSCAFHVPGSIVRRNLTDAFERSSSATALKRTPVALQVRTAERRAVPPAALATAAGAHELRRPPAAHLATRAIGTLLRALATTTRATGGIGKGEGRGRRRGTRLPRMSGR